MLDVRANSLLRHHSLITGIMQTVYDFDRVAVERIYELIGELQCVKKQCGPEIEDAVTALCEEIQERLAWATSRAYPLTPKDREMILAACDEVRVHLIAGALGACRTRRAGQSSLEARIIRVREASVRSIVHGRGGVTHGSFQQYRVIVFPRVLSDEQWSELFDELISIYEQKTPGEDWVIDLSLLVELPALFLANLIAYAGRLHAEGDDVCLAWLRPELLEGPQLERARTFFSLELIDGWYFTRGTVVAPERRPAPVSPRLSQ